MLPPAPPPPAQSPPEAQPLEVAGRVGFGVGIFAIPGGWSSSLGALGATQPIGGVVGIRWWVKERLAVLPSLNLSISHSTVPNTTEFQTYIQGGSFTNGTVAPALSLGYAAYRGKTTRFLLIGGLGFSYETQAERQSIPTTGNGGGTSRYVTSKTLGFNVPFGFALEQFFTSRISAVVGAQAPLFEYQSTKIGNADAATTIGSNFSATQLGASIYFYTD